MIIRVDWNLLFSRFPDLPLNQAGLVGAGQTAEIFKLNVGYNQKANQKNKRAHHNFPLGSEDRPNIPAFDYGLESLTDSKETR